MIKRFIICRMRNLFILLLVLLTFGLPTVFGQDSISRIDIQGNKVVSDATIVSKIKIRAGQDYNENIINADVKNLYATGFFDSVEVEKKDAAQGPVVIFKVKEKPVLKEVDFVNSRYIRKKRMEDTLGIKEGMFIDDYKLKEVVKKIKDIYAKKGFTQAEVVYDMDVSEDNEANVTFTVNENLVVKVRKVSIKGNITFSATRIIRLMKTRPAWLFNRGVFKEEVLMDDLERVKDFYRLEGFSDVAAEADVEIDAKGVYVTVLIDEGDRYHLGSIQVEGNDDISLAAIEGAMQLKEGDIYSEQVVYEESSRIKEVYMDGGYIFVQIEPLSYYNPATKSVDVTFKIIENQIAYVEEIDVRGNLKTRDKVVRRELRVYPGDKFSGAKVKKSKERLENLGFFEEIRFGTEPGSEADKVDLTVDVKESKTGYISFGGGYSSIDEFIGFVELRQRNFDFSNWNTFTGAGQDLSLTCSLGTLTDHYQLSFTNPWIFDRPISFGFDGYKKGHKREDDVGYAYEEDVRGGALRLGKEFNDNVKGQVAYRLERVEISDVIEDATDELKDEEGVNHLSSTEYAINYDSRDNVFVPSQGIFFTNNFQVTGGPFGGDKDFTKYFSRLSFYFPMVKKSVVELRLRGGWADPFDSTEKVPIYERFFAGGSSTIRGYRERKVGPIDSKTDDPIGGESMFVSNVEYTYPLTDFLKVATFFDAGNVWEESGDFFKDDLFKSIGLGFRVKTPIGPISVDYGWPLDLEPGEDSKEGRFHFSVSRGF